MMKLLFMSLPMILNIMMLFLISIPMKFNKFHPLKLVIILIILIILIFLKMNLFFKSWMNFFLLLIMIGGLMIIFMYITSLNNNNLLKFNLNDILKNLLKFILMMIFLLIIFYKIKLMYFFNMQDLMNLNLSINEEMNDFHLMNLFNSNKSSMIYIILYLYFSLICIMNICYKMKSPLRQINYYE